MGSWFVLIVDYMFLGFGGGCSYFGVLDILYYYLYSCLVFEVVKGK